MPTELLISGDGIAPRQVFPIVEGLSEEDVRRLMDTESE